MDYSKYEVVIIGGDHYNTLWTARSLGAVSIKIELSQVQKL